MVGAEGVVSYKGNYSAWAHLCAWQGVGNSNLFCVGSFIEVLLVVVRL